MDIVKEDTKVISNNENHNCTKCGIYFIDKTSLEKHISLHSFTEKCLTEAEMALRRKLLYQEVHKQQNDLTKDFVNPLGKDKMGDLKPRRIYRPKSKRVGLTKIRMEDCLRCDACSCIYIDPADYFKHMRNFHQKYNTIIPRSRKRSPIRKININFENRTDLGLNNTVPYNMDTISSGNITPSANDHLFNKHIRDKIKIRWSEVVSQRLSPQTKTIKLEPIEETDMGLLLSNVEVNIKTEPPDF